MAGRRGFNAFRHRRERTYARPVTEKEIRERAEFDPERYLHGPQGRDPIRAALAHALDREAIDRKASEWKINPRAAEIQARLNIASFFAAPSSQVSERARKVAASHAARAEDWYAYAPLSEDPRSVDWNIWLTTPEHPRGQRIPLYEWSQAIEKQLGGE